MMMRNANFVYDLITGHTLQQASGRNGSSDLALMYDDIRYARIALENSEKRMFDALVELHLIVQDQDAIRLTLESAMRMHKLVAICYMGKNGEETLRNIMPIEFKDGSCVARCFLRQDTRRFSPDRIKWLLKSVMPSLPCPTYSERIFPKYKGSAI